MSDSTYAWHPVDLSPGPEGDGPDVDTALEIVRAADLAVAGHCDETRESVRAMLTSPEALREETRIIRSRDGKPIGLLLLEHMTPVRTTFVEAYVVPRHADDLYPLLLEEAARGARKHVGEGDWLLDAGVLSTDEVSTRTLIAQGFTPIRHFWRMRIDFGDDAGVVEPAPPSGVSLHVVESDEDRHLLHAIDEVAFAEHFGFTARPYEEWISWFEHRSDARPDLWWLAYLDGEPVGLCIGDDSRAEEGLAYVRVLGVTPPARGRGIARWLLGMAFVRAARDGRRGALLTTDSENTTGAVRLYEGMGMRPEQVIDVYRRALP